MVDIAAHRCSHVQLDIPGMLNILAHLCRERAPASGRWRQRFRMAETSTLTELPQHEFKSPKQCPLLMEFWIHQAHGSLFYAALSHGSYKFRNLGSTAA